MTISDAHSLYLLLTANAVLLGAAAIAVIRFRKRCERLERFWNSPTGTAIADQKSEQDRLQLVTLMRLERGLNELQANVDSLASRPRKQATADVRQLPIENAVRMVRNGASVDDLTRTCGLNIGEARLLRKMHGNVTAASA